MGFHDATRFFVRPERTTLYPRHYDIADAEGSALGTIDGKPSRLELRDEDGRPVARYRRRASWLHAIVDFADPRGVPIGTVAQVTALGPPRFGILDANGEPVGAVVKSDTGLLAFDVVDGTGLRVVDLERGIGTLTLPGTYRIDLVAAPSDEIRVIAFAALLAIDKKLHRNRRAWAGGGSA